MAMAGNTQLRADGASHSEGTHVLVVEDDESLRDVLSRSIQRAGFSCSSASSAEMALELFDTNNIEVVIVDIRLPGMDGLEFTRLVKKSHDPVAIVMTGYSEEYSYEDAVTSGACDFVVKPVRPEELLIRVNRGIAEHEASRERDRLVENLRTLVITDELTKLHNSRHFYSQAKIEIDRAVRYGRPLALLVVDVDKFKEYNDEFGHLKGDHVLACIGGIIKSSLRAMDSAYRYGGEEFTLLLPETDGPAAEVAAERLRAAVESEELHPQPGRDADVTISVGLTEYAPGEDLTTFVQRADQAMYTSKRQGRNCVHALYAE